MSASPARVAVCILNWNGLTDTIECLQSLRDSTYPNLQIIVLDNGSREDPTLLQEQFPEIVLLREPANLGYAAGNNRAAAVALEAHCDYLLFLNNDTVVPPEMIGLLVAAYQAAPQAGLVAPRERPYDAPEAPHRLGAMWEPLRCKVRWVYAAADEELPDLLELDAVSGCALMISREVAESAGLFDEGFFAYWEDTDLSLRARKARYRNYCATGVHVLHKSGRSTGSDSGPNLAQLYLVCRGQAIIARKHARGLARVVAPLWMLCSGLAAKARALLSPAYHAEGHAKCQGFRDGFQRRPPSERWIRR
jgi:GT2 family glycosyltransferase